MQTISKVERKNVQIISFITYKKNRIFYRNEIVIQDYKIYTWLFHDKFENEISVKSMPFFLSSGILKCLNLLYQFGLSIDFCTNYINFA